MNMTSRAVLSFAFMQVGWFACVLGAAREYPWLGPAIVLEGLAVHVWAQPRGARVNEVLILAFAAVLGFLVDTALLRGGVMSVAGAAVSPAWLVALWPNLGAATARGGSLASLERRPILGVLLGLLGGPLAYDAGVRLGAIGVAGGRLGALAIIGAAWSLVLPALFFLRRLMGTPHGHGGEMRLGPG